jgi:hypothetical protein
MDDTMKPKCDRCSGDKYISGAWPNMPDEPCPKCNPNAPSGAERVAQCAARHVSGSLLPSNSPRILQPVQTPFGVLQVRVIAELDAHGLFLKTEQGETVLAEHGNGYSCFELGKRMVEGDEARVRQQAQYILDCGGMTRNIDHIINAIS